MTTDALTVVPPSPFQIPLPRFRRPLTDPELPEVTGDPGPTTSDPTPTTSGRPPVAGPDDAPPLPPVLNPDRPARTRTSSAGDPKVAREVIAGLIAVVCGIAFTYAARRGRHFRQPDPSDIEGVAGPLGRIMARHLPTDVIGPDLVDGTAAAAAIHAYVTDGPLLSRYPEPLPEELS